TNGRLHAAADPREMRRSGCLRPATSFEMFHPPNVFEIVHLLECRQVAKIETEHRPAGRLAYPRHEALRLRDFPIFGDDQSQAIGDQRCKGAAFGGSLAFRPLEKILGKSNSRSFRHMSRHMTKTAICQTGNDAPPKGGWRSIYLRNIKAGPRVF